MVLGECLSDQYHYVIKTCHKIVYFTASPLACFSQPQGPGGVAAAVGDSFGASRASVCPDDPQIHAYSWSLAKPGVQGNPTQVCQETGGVTLTSILHQRTCGGARAHMHMHVHIHKKMQKHADCP